jgi:hypothetical protein
MSKAAGQPSANVLTRVVDLLIESRIRIDAMEQILVKTNPVAYELYLGTTKNLQQKRSGNEPSAYPKARIIACRKIDGPLQSPVSSILPC